MNLLDTLRRYWLEAAAVALLAIVLALALSMCGDTPSPTDRAQAVLDSTASARQDSTDAALTAADSLARAAGQDAQDAADSASTEPTVDPTLTPEDAHAAYRARRDSLCARGLLSACPR